MDYHFQLLFYSHSIVYTITVKVGVIMDKITFGKFIRDHRKKAGMTQNDLATLLGVNTNSIGNIERGQTYPDADKLFKLITILNLSIDSLMLAECRLGESLLPAALNQRIAKMSAQNRGIVMATLDTLTDQLTQKETNQANEKGTTVS